MKVLEIELGSAAATEALAALVGEDWWDPLCVGLSGDLGAGKTSFTRFFVTAMDPGVAEWICSPTYAISNHYPTEPSVYHLDLYRLTSFDDLESVGFWDLREGALMFIEWPERIQEVMQILDVHLCFKKSGELSERRVLQINAKTSLGARFAEALAASSAAVEGATLLGLPTTVEEDV